MASIAFTDILVALSVTLSLVSLFAVFLGTALLFQTRTANKLKAQMAELTSDLHCVRCERARVLQSNIELRKVMLHHGTPFPTTPITVPTTSVHPAPMPGNHQHSTSELADK